MSPYAWRSVVTRDGSLRALREHFAEVHRPAIRGNRPEDIGQIFLAEAVGRYQALKLYIDGHAAAFALDFRLSPPLRQQAGALKADPGCPAAMKVVDGWDIAPHDFDAIDGDPIARLSLRLLWRRLLGGRVHLLRESRAQKSERAKNSSGGTGSSSCLPSWHLPDSGSRKCRQRNLVLQLSEMPEALFGQDEGQEIEDENVEGELLKTRLTAIVAMG